MSGISITKQRLKELERAEAKMAALEAGGVDNWEWYGESLSEYRKENEREELTDDLIEELSSAFGECAYEPSERGAGIAFNDEVHDSVKGILSRAGITFKSLLDGELK
jgi:hypothetical protein